MRISSQRAVQYAEFDVVSRLETARTEIETRFTEGGLVLVSVLDVVDRLIGALDDVSKVMDVSTGGDTTQHLLDTVATLRLLPTTELQRHDNLKKVLDVGQRVNPLIETMQETLRYLKIFAITTKITGAGLVEFSGFAEEIAERIHSANDQVTAFSAQLQTLHAQLVRASQVDEKTSSEHADTIPTLAEDLLKDASTIRQRQNDLATMARQVASLAHGVQGKVSKVLSSLQVGDITRQRIEHVQHGLQLLSSFSPRPAVEWSNDHQQRLANVVHVLLAAQMDDIVEEFTRQTATIIENIGSLSQDTREIDSLRRVTDGADTGVNFMAALQGSLSQTQVLVKHVEAGIRQATEVSLATTATAQELIGSIDGIRAVKTDIHYMALNANLRCSRLGEQGRSINVIAAELRIFAAKLDDTADSIGQELSALDQAAQQVNADIGDNPDHLSQRLDIAADNISLASRKMETHLSALAEHGDKIGSTIDGSARKLDFQQALGSILGECTGLLHERGDGDSLDTTGIEEAVHELSMQLMTIYTMASERETHQRIIPTEGASEAPQSADLDDDDLFADALF